MPVFSLASDNSSFTVCADGTPLHTPGKNTLQLPTRALANAILGEWRSPPLLPPPASGGRLGGGKPLTALAYTAIDRIAPQTSAIVEALLVYIDTDTLSYRASASDKLAAQQDKEWNPILIWAARTFGATWIVTGGVMPVDQPPALHTSITAYLQKYTGMQLAAACMLASGCSSLVLALAVLNKQIDAAEAFRLSRLEEDAQAEQWGRNEEVEQRAARLKVEIVAAGEFLRLLDAA